MENNEADAVGNQFAGDQAIGRAENVASDKPNVYGIATGIDYECLGGCAFDVDYSRTAKFINTLKLMLKALA